MTRLQWQTFAVAAPLALGLTVVALAGVDVFRSAPDVDWWGLAARVGRCVWGHG